MVYASSPVLGLGDAGGIYDRGGGALPGRRVDVGVGHRGAGVDEVLDVGGHRVDRLGVLGVDLVDVGVLAAVGGDIGDVLVDGRLIGGARRAVGFRVAVAGRSPVDRRDRDLAGLGRGAHHGSALIDQRRCTARADAGLSGVGGARCVGGRAGGRRGHCGAGPREGQGGDRRGDYGETVPDPQPGSSLAKSWHVRLLWFVGPARATRPASSLASRRGLPAHQARQNLDPASEHVGGGPAGGAGGGELRV